MSLEWEKIKHYISEGKILISFITFSPFLLCYILCHKKSIFCMMARLDYLSSLIGWIKMTDRKCCAALAAFLVRGGECVHACIRTSSKLMKNFRLSGQWWHDRIIFYIWYLRVNDIEWREVQCSCETNQNSKQCLHFDYVYQASDRQTDRQRESINQSGKKIGGLVGWLAGWLAV